MERLRWISDAVHLELLALCQCLPGPSSTQLSFALGITQQGATGGLVSGELLLDLIVPQRGRFSSAHGILWMGRQSRKTVAQWEWDVSYREVQGPGPSVTTSHPGSL